MEDEELELWVDDQKETVTGVYFKKLEQSRLKEIPQAPKQIEEEFLTAMRNIRTEYQLRYERMRATKEKQVRRKKKKARVMSKCAVLFMIVGAAWRVLHRAITGIFIGVRFVVKGSGAAITKGVYALRQWYTFHAKRPLQPLLGPLKKVLRWLLRPLSTAWISLLDAKKHVTETLIKKSKKLFDITLKYAKIVAGVLQKNLTKLAKVLAAVFKVVNKFVGIFIKPVFGLLFGWIGKLAKKKGEEE